MPEHETVVVIGAGMAGLGAALALREGGRDCLVLEREGRPGGLAQTDNVEGFRFDIAGHFVHGQNHRIVEEWSNLGVPMERIRRRSAVIAKGILTAYPFQYNLWPYGPAFHRQVLAELRDTGDHRFGHPAHFGERLLAEFGPTMVEAFFRPYNEKIWGLALEALPVDCAGKYLPQADVDLIRRGCGQPTDYQGYNGVFFYPESGIFADVPSAVAGAINGHLRCGVEVSRIDLVSRHCVGDDGSVTPFSHIISTTPVTNLPGLCGAGFGFDPIFDYTETANVRVGFCGRMRCNFHWIYLADPEVPVYRVGFPRNVNPATCPDGCASLSLEYTLPREGARLSPSAVAENAVEYLKAFGLIEVEECVTVSERIISPAYVVNRGAEEAFAALREALARDGVHLAGRYGEWSYFSLTEAFESGAAAAQRVLHAWTL